VSRQLSRSVDIENGDLRSKRTALKSTVGLDLGISQRRTRALSRKICPGGPHGHGCNSFHAHHHDVRLPYGAYCAIYSLSISRESTQLTVKAALTRIVSYALGAIYVLIGAIIFLDDPMLRLLWVIGSMFMAFYAISAMAIEGSATAVAYLIVITVSLWDEHISGELRLEGTLWVVFALSNRECGCRGCRVAV
jgi:hypothetical protein